MTNGLIQIGRPRPEDHPGVAELLALLGYPVPANTVARRLTRRGGDQVFVATRDHEVLGFVSMRYQFPFGSEFRTARITGLVVREDVRRQGIARLLMEHAHARARARGCGMVEVTSGLRPEREAAHRFYEDLGYVHIAKHFRISMDD